MNQEAFEDIPEMLDRAITDLTSLREALNDVATTLIEINTSIETMLGSDVFDPRTCLDGHAEPVTNVHLEQNDDRYDVLFIERCSRCNMPLGDRYATRVEINKLQAEGKYHENATV